MDFREEIANGENKEDVKKIIAIKNELVEEDNRIKSNKRGNKNEDKMDEKELKADKIKRDEGVEGGNGQYTKY